MAQSPAEARRGASGGPAAGERNRGLQRNRCIAAQWGLNGLAAPVLQSRRGRSLPLQVTLGVVLTCLFAALPGAVFAIWAMLQVDTVAAEREKALLRRGFDDAISALAREQQSVTVRDEAGFATLTGDQKWMAENLGEWMHTFYGHDRAYVIDTRNKPIHAMRNGVTEPDPASSSAEVARFVPLIEQLRAELENTTSKRGNLGARGLMWISGKPSIVSVKAIVPEADRMVPVPGSEYLHIVVRHLDATFLNTLEKSFMLRDIRFQTYVPEKEAEMPLGAPDGLLGFLTWKVDRPGWQVVEQTLPGIAASTLLMLGLVGFLVTRLRRTALQLHSSEMQAQHMARHDPLTGLPNRTLFNERLEYALATTVRQGSWVALHYLDLDHFKNVNDTLGHAAGDALIRQVGERLRGLVREGDTVARLGGDEFAIVQSGLSDPAEAEQVAKRILREIKAPFRLCPDLAFVDVSIGIALAPDAVETRSELMRKADIALYEAKGQGKGRLRVFEAELDRVVRQKRAIEHDLRDALDRGIGLHVSYQPIYAADGRGLVGAEALVRWKHPSHGMLSPAVFVPVAEERGLMPRLGSWILREACRTAKKLDLPWIAVNVSAVQLREPDFADSVFNLLEEIGLPPEQLQLEITEGLLLDAHVAVTGALGRLRLAGVRIALDDFGTGYSSLQYLKRYTVDKIKIDRSFVQGLGTDEESSAIVRTMLDLARALRLDVTAEGVETQAQWQMLRDLRCDEMQGFLFSKPVGRDQLDLLIGIDGTRSLLLPA